MSSSKLYSIGLGVLLIAVSSFFLSSCTPVKSQDKKPQAQNKPAASVPAKKPISKGMGSLNVKVANSKSMPLSLSVKAFRHLDSRSGIFQSSFSTNTPQELIPGTYDIELSSNPQRIYKNIRVDEGREAIENIGSITGSIVVKAVNSQKKAASYPVRIMQTGTKISAGNSIANRSFEVAPGVYDIEIGTVPSITKRGVRIDAGKESVVEIGAVTGDLIVKCLDENKKEQRVTVRIKKSGANDVVASTSANRPIEITEGLYDVEVASNPPQTSNRVSVKAGAATQIEITVPASAASTQTRANPIAGLPAKR
ncbi:MAG TPA: hypothetical protein PLV52_00675 [Candidatus Omnitrophota bacterium]|nr:hypothetical protein [Candidatus Omnitrophota bacterium]